MKKQNDRRQFLKNASLATLSLGLLPQISKAIQPKPDDLAIQGECNPTTLDFYGEGPFYTENPPEIEETQLADPDEPGIRLTITGRVRNLDCTQFIPETIIDVWHANDAGQYDNVGYNLRGKTTTNAQGFYAFETIYPGKYLNGANFRPSHIHFRITPPGFALLTTQLYFEGDPDNSTDAASSITSGQFNATDRIIPLTTNADGSREGIWDIIVDGDGVSGVNDIHIDKGMIYSAGPNPFSDRISIRYGVFKPAKVGLIVYDLNGHTVSTLTDRRLNPDKYEAIWQPDSWLPNGHYFIALKINDVQVHYLKVVRKK